MIGDCPFKVAVSPFQIMAIQYGIHQIKGSIFLYLLMYVILEIDMKFKICIQKYFFGFYFSIVHISTNIVFRNLESRVAIGEIHVEGTVSQNLVLGLSFYSMQKKG